MTARTPSPSLTFLDHTADVGFEVTAPDPASLFVKAATGLRALLEGGEEGAETVPEAAPPADPSLRRSIDLAAEDRATLLRAWLRELLHAHEADGLAFRSARFEVLDREHLEAEVAFQPAPRPIREIKGVTLHGLEVEERGNTWWGRVIFDV